MCSKSGETVRSDSFFQCTSGVNVNLDQLCDGFDNCNGGGDDETTPLCASELSCMTQCIIFKYIIHIYTSIL